MNKFKAKHPELSQETFNEIKMLFLDSNEESFSLLESIVGFLAYHGTINYGNMRQNFGDRIDELRKVQDENKKSLKNTAW